MSNKRTRGVQATLRRVIRLGRYGADVFDEARGVYSRERYMCCALAEAAAAGEITEDEFARATDAIAAYMGDRCASMARRLQIAGLWCGEGRDEFADTVGRQLYWDWDRRPSLD